MHDIRDGKTKPSSFISTRNLWVFPDGYQQSITVGTVMEQTHMELSIWFLGAYLMATLTPGVSARQFARQAGLHYETAYMLLMKLRAGLINPFRTKLKGVIEIDESYIGGKVEGKHGRGAESKAVVLGAVEVIDTSKKKIGGRLRLRKVSSPSGENILKFIEDNIEKGSVLVTDGWKGYNAVTRHGYERRIVEGEDTIEVAAQLVHIHRAFSNLKTWINGTHHGVSRKHLQAYLNEFVFRYNRRRVPFEAFNAILGIGSIREAPTYRGLYKAGEIYGWIHPNPKRPRSRSTVNPSDASGNAKIH
ncbi:MAG TPA: IS1595 family transposase [Candidatus Acidoferrales bacterium]|nr:IS1595 family transposase [Candidatus Acidoferrales bacterium]